MISLATALSRLALALVFGAIIGIEREWRHKNAGIKTNTLVALGAATFAMLSNTVGPNNNNPAQIAAAVVTGIGFIGAGVIIHRGATVQGVTTAATLWANASMGLAAGLGQTTVAATMFAAVIIVQFTMRTIGKWIQRYHVRVSRIDVRVDATKDTLQSINEVWSAYAQEIHATVMKRGVARSDQTWMWRVTFIVSGRKPPDLGKLEEQLAALGGIRHVEARFAGYQEEPDAVM